MSAQPTGVADFELGVIAHGGGHSLAVRFTYVGDIADIRHPPFACAFNHDDLRALLHNTHAYGLALWGMLFAAPSAANAFYSARAAALSRGSLLRIRLMLPPELQALRWEWLADPRSGKPLAIDGRLLLSRYIPANDYTPITPLPRRAQRALVAVAAPVDAEDLGLTPLDPDHQIALVASSLQQLQVTTLGASNKPRASWPALADQLRAGCHILYLVAHGTLRERSPWLMLEDEHGHVAPLDASLLIDLIKSLNERRPRIVVLVSCESAGDGHFETIAALGPRLAEAGVPAVVAMSGRISIAAVEHFMPVFLAELLRHGLPDRAMALARLSLADGDYWWAPILFSRLQRDPIWEGAAAEVTLRPQHGPARGLPPATLQSLRLALLNCEEFASDRRLRAVFTTEKLKLWQHRLPEADNRRERVDLVIAFLLDQRHSSGDPALTLLVEALLDNNHDNSALAEQLRCELEALRTLT